MCSFAKKTTPVRPFWKRSLDVAVSHVHGGAVAEGVAGGAYVTPAIVDMPTQTVLKSAKLPDMRQMMF